MELDNVSRETLDRLRQYEALLIKWNTAINLVARSTIAGLWSRHFVDSAQILQFCPDGATHWADLGTGGGFPGLVVAIIAAETRPNLRFTLIESDQRKATFLREVDRQLGVGAKIVADRIENASPLGADVVSARALAPMTALCAYAARHCAADGTAIFQKGASFALEMAEAQNTWDFDHKVYISQTDPAAVVLAVTKLRQRRAA